MTDFTPKSSTDLSNKKNRASKAKTTLKKVLKAKPLLHASADALLFVRLFARAAQA